jgi:CRISPR-associated endoribonuclease Cas6
MTLISAVLTLQPTVPATVPACLGQTTHAWFVDQVRRLDPALAESLHTPNQERPFTVSNLWGPRVFMAHPSGFTDAAGVDDRPGRNLQGLAQAALSPDHPCFLRVTSYQPTLSALLAGRLLPSLPETIALAGATLRVVDATADATQHPWAGQTSMQDLLRQHTLQGQPEPQVTLHFASPTVFRSQEMMLPLPLPRLVFGGLVRRWNAEAPIALPAEVNRFADECLAISRHRIRTERVVFGEGGKRGAFPGFVGNVTYAFRVRDRYWMGLIKLLAAFALYAGVGQRVTMGLGQARNR